MTDLRGGSSTLLILDVRDDDAVGGHIRNAHHFPDSTFASRIDEVVDLIKEKKPTKIVTHCMESVMRGPRCARRLVEILAPEDAAKVRVLKGGASLFIREYATTEWVQDFDDDYWSLEGGGGSSSAAATAESSSCS